MDWDRYRTYVQEGGYEATPPGPELDLGPESGTTPIAFRPVEGTRVGIFAADRYGVPDVPAYYEYRFAVFSTAGQAQSPTAYSPFVKPLFDALRQCPTTEGKFAAELTDANTLVLRVNLVHPRLHLRAEMRGLWVTSDDLIALPGAGEGGGDGNGNGNGNDEGEDTGSDAIPVRFGSLPDLFAEYQIYLNANYRPEAPTAPAVLNHLVDLLPPFDPQRSEEGEDVPRRFLARSPDEHMVRILPPDRSGEGAIENEVEVEQAEDGSLRLVIPLRFTAEAGSYMTPITRADAQEPKEFERVFYFSIRRGGVSSSIVPQTQPTRTATESENEEGSPDGP